MVTHMLLSAGGCRGGEADLHVIQDCITHMEVAGPSNNVPVILGIMLYLKNTCNRNIEVFQWYFI